MKRAGVAVTLALFVALAGCLDADEERARIAEEEEEAAQADAIAPPEWGVGHYWTYDSPNGTVTFVVAGEQGGDWIMETTNSDLAFFHAMYEVSYLGAVRKSDLAGSQGSDRVEFFRFPLENDKEWTTRWDGLSIEITATQTGPGKFDFVGMDGARKHVEYSYDHEKGFFTKATWYDADGGEWGFTLTGSGKDFSGTLNRYTIGATHTFVAGLADSQVHEIDIAAEWNEIALRTILLCNDDPFGLIAVGVNSPAAEESPLPMLPELNEPEGGDSLECDSGQMSHNTWLMENPGGTWEVGLLVATPNGLAHLFMEERGREEVAFP